MGSPIQPCNFNDNALQRFPLSDTSSTTLQKAEAAVREMGNEPAGICGDANAVYIQAKPQPSRGMSPSTELTIALLAQEQLRRELQEISSQIEQTTQLGAMLRSMDPKSVSEQNLVVIAGAAVASAVGLFGIGVPLANDFAAWQAVRNPGGLSDRWTEYNALRKQAVEHGCNWGIGSPEYRAQLAGIGRSLLKPAAIGAVSYFALDWMMAPEEMPPLDLSAFASSGGPSDESVKAKIDAETARLKSLSDPQIVEELKAVKERTLDLLGQKQKTLVDLGRLQNENRLLSMSRLRDVDLSQYNSEDLKEMASLAEQLEAKIQEEQTARKWLGGTVFLGAGALGTAIGFGPAQHWTKKWLDGFAFHQRMGRLDQTNQELNRRLAAEKWKKIQPTLQCKKPPQGNLEPSVVAEPAAAPQAAPAAETQQAFTPLFTPAPAQVPLTGARQWVAGQSHALAGRWQGMVHTAQAAFSAFEPMPAAAGGAGGSVSVRVQTPRVAPMTRPVIAPQTPSGISGVNNALAGGLMAAQIGGMLFGGYVDQQLEGERCDGFVGTLQCAVNGADARIRAWHDQYFAPFDPNQIY